MLFGAFILAWVMWVLYNVLTAEGGSRGGFEPEPVLGNSATSGSGGFG